MLYRTIVIDPPWKYSNTLVVTGNAIGRTKQAGRSGTNYPTMTIQEVKDLPVKSLADPTGCHIYLWTTNTHVEFAWDILRGWGFTPKNLLTWAKKPKGMIGFGVFSQASEFCLFGSMGENIRIGRCETTWWQWARRAHSQKPEEFQDIVERVSPAPYLEMFARRPRSGWSVFGNEVEGSIRLLTPRATDATNTRR